MIHRLLPVLALTVSLATDLRSQLLPGCTHKYSLLDVLYTLSSGPFERTEVLQACAPKHYRDAVVLRGGQLGRLIACGVWNRIEPLVGDVSDFVVVPKHALQSEYDRLLITQPTGGNVTFVSWTNQQTPVFHQAALALFTGARKLTVAATANGHDLAGVAPDGMTVVRAELAGNGATGVSTFNLGRPIQSIALGDRDGDGVLELFCVVDLGVVILTRLGSVFAVMPSDHPGGFVAATGSRVVWLARRPDNSGWNLRCIAGGGQIPTSAPVALHGQDFDAIGIRASNGDQQGELDVVIAQRTTQELLLVRLQTSMQQTFGTICQEIPMSPTPLASGSLTACLPAVSDLDGDGYSDYVLARNQAATITIARGTAQGRDYAPVTMDELLYEETFFQHDGTTTNPANGLKLRLNNVPELFSAFQSVSLNLWTQGNSMAQVASVAKLTAIYTISPGEGHAQELFVPSWLTPHAPAAYHHLEILFLADNGEPGPLFTVAGYSHDSTTAAAENNYIANQNQLLFDLSYDGSEPQHIYQQPPVGGYRILLGGHVRSARIPPAESFPSPAQSTHSGSTTLID